MGRELHNWRRRAKLIEKHTGKVYDPYKNSRYTPYWGSEQNWSSGQSWSGSGWGSDDWSSSNNQHEARRPSRGDGATKPKSSHEKGKPSKLKLVNKVKKLSRGDARQAEGDASGEGPPKRRKLRKSATGSRKPDAMRDLLVGEARRRAAEEGDDAALPRKLKKRKKNLEKQEQAPTTMEDPVNESARRRKRKLSTGPRTSDAMKDLLLGEARRRAAEAGEEVAPPRRLKRNKIAEGETTGKPQSTKRILAKPGKVAMKRGTAAGKEDKTHPAKMRRSERVMDNAAPLSKRQLRRARIAERRFLRVGATVVCPGSVADRFSRGLHNFCYHVPLTGNEMKLLSTGGLSWRWLRDENDVSGVPGGSRPAPTTDHEGHRAAMGTLSTRGRAAAVRLKLVDSRLGTDSLWPICARRAELAGKLLAKGALNRRCERHFKEVVEPLISGERSEPDGGGGHGSDCSESDSDGAGRAVGSTVVTTDVTRKADSSSAPMLVEARRLLVTCASEWKELAGTPKNRSPAVSSAAAAPDDASIHKIWTRMLRMALALREEESSNGRAEAWLRALRCAALARLCPQTDAAAQRTMLENVAEYAVIDRPENNTAPSGGAAGSQPPVVLPLGVFTFWQALLLTAAARWLGHEALVVRRSATGVPEVFFRTADQDAGGPPDGGAIASSAADV